VWPRLAEQARNVALWQQDPFLGPVPDEFAGVLQLVLGDLQRPKPIALFCGWDGSYVWIREPNARGSYGWGPSEESLSFAAMAVEMADELQEQFLWESDGAWAEPRPQCPGHPHPALAELIDDEPW
jgi:hypothetical protein